jgi:hypothetical protein
LPAHDPERVTEYPPAGSVTLYDVIEGEKRLTWFSDAALLLLSARRTKVNLYVRVAPLDAVPNMYTSFGTETVRDFVADHEPLEVGTPSILMVVVPSCLYARTLK